MGWGSKAAVVAVAATGEQWLWFQVPVALCANCGDIGRRYRLVSSGASGMKVMLNKSKVR